MSEIHDLCIIGGGVNGTGIARDAAGRGWSVVLCEKGDLASATSSASTKLFHGGLRYLEHYAFGLVRQALREREVLLATMPHISWPMRFVLPHHAGLRPAWLLRMGLFLYDHIGGRRSLPGTRVVDLRDDPVGAPLQDRYTRGFEYSDGWVDDARLVVLNARDAADRGAEILVGTRVIRAARKDGVFVVDVEGENGPRTIRARSVVNAAGPWVSGVGGDIRQRNVARMRLVRGSHIVTRKLFDHDRAYIFQHGDGRVIFAIPYEDDFTLIGTTDVDHDGDPSDAKCTPEERDYLCELASDYFREPVTADDVVWTFAGVRALLDDGSSDAAKATRDYRLELETGMGAPLLTVYGGKITTYRKLAERAVDRLSRPLRLGGKPWTARVPLPGGDFEMGGQRAQVQRLCESAPWLPEAVAARMIRSYGTLAARILGDARDLSGLGRDFGHGLYEAEVRYLMDREWAQTASDVLWRRSKLGLHFTNAEADALGAWMAEKRGQASGERSAAG